MTQTSESWPRAWAFPMDLLTDNLTPDHWHLVMHPRTNLALGHQQTVADRQQVDLDDVHWLSEPLLPFLDVFDPAGVGLVRWGNNLDDRYQGPIRECPVLDPPLTDFFQILECQGNRDRFQARQGPTFRSGRAVSTAEHPETTSVGQ